MKGWALAKSFGAFSDIVRSSNNNPLRSKKSPLSSCSTAGNKSWFFERRLRQRVSRLFGVFGRRCFHDNQNAFLRKCLGQLQFALMPRQILGNQSFDIRIDRESRDIEGGRSQHQQRAGNDNRPPIAGAEIDNSDDRWIYRHGRRAAFDLLRRGNPGSIIHAPSFPDSHDDAIPQPHERDRAERVARSCPSWATDRNSKTSVATCSVSGFLGHQSSCGDSRVIELLAAVGSIFGINGAARLRRCTGVALVRAAQRQFSSPATTPCLRRTAKPPIGGAIARVSRPFRS